MLRFGAAATAKTAQDTQQQGTLVRQQGTKEGQVGEKQEATHAQRIVRELHQRYQKQLQRWKDYRSLFFFLSFVALFLAVLYTQRQANTAYKVHATLEEVLVPSDDTMGSSDDVYTWIKQLLTTVWVDPKCGDGICESPFEFASYSRFGCRADCGKLQDIQKLTRVQVDGTYDFNHPIGSMPAADLMQQTSWNLCPLQTNFASGCYYDSDQTFTKLSGQLGPIIIPDMPDGDWDLIMRRDIFMKTQGAVRDYNQLQAVSFYYRVYVAAISAIAEQNTEMQVLRRAIANAGLSLFDFINNNMVSVSKVNSTEASFYTQQFRNATCNCAGVPIVNSSASWDGSSLMVPFNNSMYVPAGYTAYQNTNCTGTASPDLYVYDTVTDSSGTYHVARAVDQTNTTDFSAFCYGAITNLTWWRDVHINATRDLMLTVRLGDGQKTGKIAARNLVANAIKSWVVNNSTGELYSPLFDYPKGQLALDTSGNGIVMPDARIDILQDQFVQGKLYSTRPQPALLAASRKYLIQPDITQASMMAKAIARINETRFQQMDTLSNITVKQDTTYNYGYPDSMTIQQLLKAFWAATGSLTGTSSNCTNPKQGCTWVQLTDNTTTIFLPNNTLPDATSSALNTTDWGGAGLQTNYNLVVWKGNTTAYMTCGLDQRAPEYLGTCQDMPVTCAATGNDTTPYNCTTVSTGVAVTGSITTSSTYREQCELPCDRQLDCNSVCECFGTCTSTQVCACTACFNLNYVASQDSQFIDISAFAPSTSTQLAVVSNTNVGNRRLHQVTTADLTNVLNQVGTVQTQQTTITAQLQALQAQVTQANQLAQARANDNQLVDLITAGRQDIQQGQARIESKLDEIIGKQNQSLATAQAALTALGAIQGLAQKQLAAQQSLEKAVQSQLTALKTATMGGTISLTQALAFWKKARRDKVRVWKQAYLANIPCNPLPYQDNNFPLDNGNNVDNTTARERNVGLTNRVLSGLLLHQYRTNVSNCTDSKFNKIQQTCTGEVTTASFGVDPVFKRGTDLYDPDLDDADGTEILRYYNCSLLPDAQYRSSIGNNTQNVQPYCLELYNPQNLSYAFHHLPMDGKPAGFPVLFDINLGADAASTWETWVEQGLYLDQHTRSVTAELVTYNAGLRIFGYFFVEFYFSDGGSIQVTHRLQTVRVELYNSPEDTARYAFEVILTMWVIGMLIWTLGQMLMAQKEQGNFLKYFASGWNVVDFISNGLLFSCMVIWWAFVTRYAKPFDISLRHDVYESLTPDANYLALNAQGAGMAAAWDDMQRLSRLIDMLNWYFALNGINILLLIARVLKLMDFQPRLGVVTRSLWLAGPDLLHFAVVAGMVFIGYAMMAHLIFGNAILRFQTFGDSVNTCFEILLGNIDVNTELRALGGLQSVAGALFFWSYELLVFMVLLNFLLAIIVDAFSEVKEKTHETVGIHTELYQLMRDKWRSMMGTFSADYISDARLGLLLKQWAGDDRDEQDDAQQAEVEKLLTILNEDLDEEDLRNILMECLKDAPAATTEGAAEYDAVKRDGDARSGLSRFLLPSRKAGVAATPHEISQAARYIVERFGVPVEAEEELLGGEEEEDMQPAAAGGAPLTAGVADKERDQLAHALERLAEVQRELAEGQRSLMSGQKQLAEQQAKLVGLIGTDVPQAP